MSSGLSKITIERNQKTLLELVSQPGNDACADCKARAPRWASHNIGVFLCVNCASIHRKIGTHVTKVKSLTMDSWTKEQVEMMKANGNVKSNQHYNPNELRNPPPTNMMESERDSELEQYIRSKYEYKRFLDRSAIVASKLGPSRSATMGLSSSSSTSSITSARPKTTPLSSSTLSTSSSLGSGLPPPKQPAINPAPTPPITTNTITPRSVSHPPPPGVWNDLISLQPSPSTSSVSSTLPLQFQPTSTQPFYTPQPPQQQNNGSGLSISVSYPTSLAGYADSPTSAFSGYSNSAGMASGNPYLGAQQQQQQFTPVGSSPLLGGNTSPYLGGSSPLPGQQQYNYSMNTGTPAPTPQSAQAFFQSVPQTGYIPSPSPGLQQGQQQMYQPPQNPFQQPQFTGMGMVQQQYTNSPQMQMQYQSQNPFGLQSPQQSQQYAPPQQQGQQAFVNGNGGYGQQQQVFQPTNGNGMNGNGMNGNAGGSQFTSWMNGGNGAGTNAGAGWGGM